MMAPFDVAAIMATGVAPAITIAVVAAIIPPTVAVTLIVPIATVPMIAVNILITLVVTIVLVLRINAIVLRICSRCRAEACNDKPRSGDYACNIHDRSSYPEVGYASH